MKYTRAILVAWRSRKEESHIRKHQEADHGGDGSPKFIMRVVKHYKTALSRQVGEAVRIRRRGGAGSILNSRAEFNRCRIPRLAIEEVDEEQIEEQENKELREAKEQLEKYERAWGEDRTREREQELQKARRRLARIENTVGSRKREQDSSNSKEEAAKKRLKYDVEDESWGEEQRSSTLPEEQEKRKYTKEPAGSSHVITAPGRSCVNNLAPGSSPCTTESSTKTSEPQGSRAAENTTTAPLDPKSSNGDSSLVQSSMLDFAVPIPPRQAGSTSAAFSKPSYEEERTAFVDCENEQGNEIGLAAMVNGNTLTSVTMNQEPEIEIVGTEPELNVGKPTPPVVEKCKIEKGFCETHQTKTLKRSITSKKWKDRGGGRGFGWVTQKTSKFLCEPGIVTKRTPCITKTSDKSRNLDRLPGCADDNLTRADGHTETSDVGISSESISRQAVIQTSSLNCGAPRET